jgi:demethylmenaquinone methyltransferase/2-methoxy-6-polyprenyl-1,4-benzoquinol methylase
MPRNPLVRRLYRGYSLISPRLAVALGGDPAAYRYLPRSIEAFYDPESLAGLLGDAGFTRVRFERLTFGIAAIHVGEA